MRTVRKIANFDCFSTDWEQSWATFPVLPKLGKSLLRLCSEYESEYDLAVRY